MMNRIDEVATHRSGQPERTPLQALSFSSLSAIARKFLLTRDPEWAHNFTLRVLEQGIYPRVKRANDSRLGQTIFGLTFASPIGAAAGFDKDARVTRPLFQMGFSFTEVGTVTPLPQPGNPGKRVFRLPNDRAIINRFGFNSEGFDKVYQRLLARRRSGIVGVNIGANKNSTDRIGDYVSGVRKFWNVCDYFTINISSPNTPGLRDLQNPETLNSLLSRVLGERDELLATSTTRRPIIVKISPDIDEGMIADTVAAMLEHNIDGICVGNTTTARIGLIDTEVAAEAGGLSGKPLFAKSTIMLARVAQLVNGRCPIIGTGGVDSPRAALAKIEAGANLIQIYTGLVYEGPQLIKDIQLALVSEIERAGASSLSELVGVRTAEWAAKRI